VTSSPAAQGLRALDAGVLLAGLDDQADIGEAAGGADAGQDPNVVVRIADLPEPNGDPVRAVERGPSRIDRQRAL